VARLRGVSSYARRGPTREPYDTVLLVCEGKKTETNYFARLRAVNGLSSANIHIMHSGATDPISIVEFAQARLNDFDRVFCIFDRDGHDGYDAAVARIVALNNTKIAAITSWPCFEFWVLLHFGYTSAPFARTHDVSSCDRVVREVKRHMPDYQKATPNVYDLLAGRLNDAVRHGIRLAAENRRSGSRSPATRVHELVQYLLALRAQ
jgi:RloB-like protein